jgi:hypothetical protein
MKKSVSPQVFAILLLGLLSTLAIASPVRSSKAAANGAAESKSAPAAGSVYLPPPAFSEPAKSHKTGRTTIRAQVVKQQVNSNRKKAYIVDPNSFANGLAVLAKTYPNLPRR